MANITSNYAMLLPEDRLLDPMSPWLGGWICAIRWYTGPLKGRVYNGAHMAPLRLFSCLLHKETKLRVNTFYGHALHSFGEWTVNFHALQKNKEPTYVSSWLRTWAPPTSGNAPSSTNQPPTWTQISSDAVWKNNPKFSKTICTWWWQRSHQWVEVVYNTRMTSFLIFTKNAE